MKKTNYFLAAVALCALVALSVAAIKDETGTVRYRQGAVLSFDSQVTAKDEDAAWTANYNTLLGMVASNITYGAWSVSNLTVNATTNQVAFGGTNTAPASTTIVKWVSVTVAGETNKYRLPLAW